MFLKYSNPGVLLSADPAMKKNWWRVTSANSRAAQLMESGLMTKKNRPNPIKTTLIHIAGRNTNSKLGRGTYLTGGLGGGSAPPFVTSGTTALTESV